MTTTDPPAASVDSAQAGPSGGSRLRGRVVHVAATYSLPAILIALIVVFAVLTPEYFLTVGNFKSIMLANSVIVILSLGALLPLIVGQFDLSFAANLTLSGVMAAGLYQRADVNEWVAILIGLSLSTLVGLVNGLLVAKARIAAFVTTLGMSVLVTGAVTWFASGQTFAKIPPVMRFVGQDGLLGIPIPVLIFIIFAVLAFYVLNKTPLGRNMYAVGGSADASRLSGINVDGLTILAFVGSGFLAGVAGIVQMGILGQGNPSVGPSFLLPAFAAVFLGTTAYRLGVFNVQGTVTAVFVFAVLNNGLTYLGAPYFLPPIITGIALISAALFSRFFKERTSGTVGR